MNYLRYTPAAEHPEADEQETIDGIIKGMTQQSETVGKREQHAVRASHATNTGLVVGELKIPDLPIELTQGLFDKPGTHPVAIRFAQGPGEILGDRVSTHRGMAIKVFGVEGEMLPGPPGGGADQSTNGDGRRVKRHDGTCFSDIEGYYNLPSRRTSRYVVEVNSVCCAGCGTAGCFW